MSVYIRLLDLLTELQDLADEEFYKDEDLYYDRQEAANLLSKAATAVFWTE